MTVIVAHRNTGMTGAASIRGTARLSGQVLTSVPSSDRRSWVMSRWQVLQFVLRDAEGLDAATAGKAAAVLMAIPANETGWGRNEWNYNAVGMHCTASSPQCTEWPGDAADPRLRAYEDLAEGLRDFWRLYTVRATADERAALLRGELAGLAGVYRRDVWGLGSLEGSREAYASSLFRLVLEELRAAGAPAGELPPFVAMPAGAIGAAAATGGGAGVGNVGGSTIGGAVAGAPRRAKGGLLLVGLLGLGLAFGSTKKGG